MHKSLPATRVCYRVYSRDLTESATFLIFSVIPTQCKALWRARALWAEDFKADWWRLRSWNGLDTFGLVPLARLMLTEGVFIDAAFMPHWTWNRKKWAVDVCSRAQLCYNWEALSIAEARRGDLWSSSKSRYRHTSDAEVPPGTVVALNAKSLNPQLKMQNKSKNTAKYIFLTFPYFESSKWKGFWPCWVHRFHRFIQVHPIPTKLAGCHSFWALCGRACKLRRWCTMSDKGFVWTEHRWTVSMPRCYSEQI